MRKMLTQPVAKPHWPDGIRPVAFTDVDPRLLHGLLDLAFPGRVADFVTWYGNLTTDAEFDPALCMPAVAAEGEVAGFVQCWNTGFVKDLAVSPVHRRKGVGAALMQRAFALFAERGHDHVDLKVQLADLPAYRLYTRLGMEEAADGPA